MSSAARRPVAIGCFPGLTPRLLPYIPSLQSIAEEGFRADLKTVFPAVTCTVHATLTTGLTADRHGAVGNGWYSRQHGEIFFWRQGGNLVSGEKVWHAARAADPSCTTAYVCWWYAMDAQVDYIVTPRPVYRSDGRKAEDCYAYPPELHESLTRELGPFPLFSYWGPLAGIKSTRWIAAAVDRIIDRYMPGITFFYVPHLDYDLQRFGPDSPQAARAAAEVERAVGPLLRKLRDRGITVVALSDYAMTQVRRPVHLNQALRAAGLLQVCSQQGMEYLDPCRSRAFAVADHQVAHVYVADPADLPRVRHLVAEIPGVDLVLAAPEQAKLRIDHERSGELIAVAEPGSWFTYYYWLSQDSAPDYARGVEIFRKGGYDPAELFFDPGDRFARARALLAVARGKAGFRTTMSVVPLDPACVRGSHGRPPGDGGEGPLLICSDPAAERDRYHATAVKDLVLRLAGRAPAGN
jgi:predicted AlkP superfamily pyrophosphatase or phosphodiesterase